MVEGGQQAGRDVRGWRERGDGVDVINQSLRELIARSDKTSRVGQNRADGRALSSVPESAAVHNTRAKAISTSTHASSLDIATTSHCARRPHFRYVSPPDRTSPEATPIRHELQSTRPVRAHLARLPSDRPPPTANAPLTRRRSLYRRSLKLSLDWAVHRYLWRGQAMYIRSLFEANKHVNEPRLKRVRIHSTTSPSKRHD